MNCSEVLTFAAVSVDMGVYVQTYQYDSTQMTREPGVSTDHLFLKIVPTAYTTYFVPPEAVVPMQH